MESPGCTAKYSFPLIETDRLRLEMFEVSDLEAAFRLFNDDKVQKYLAPQNRRNREQMQITLQKFLARWRERGFGLWRVSGKSTKEMLGYCGFQYLEKTLDIEIIFAFFKNFWGKGFAAEAANASLRFGFEELLFTKIYAAAHPDNLASRGVLQKIGMDFEISTKHYGIEVVTYSISHSVFSPAEELYKLTYQNFV